MEHKKLGKASDIVDSQCYCWDHNKTFSITQGCDDCRKAGWCAYYGRSCCC